jgi:predicted nucleic acid-binding protein
MTRYVVTPDVVLRLADERTVVPGEHSLVAPTLLRSQVLSLLYEAARRGEVTREDAARRLDHVRALRIRLLGDRVLQNLAWRVAEDLGWPDTLDAEYVALTKLQADALITLDARLVDAVRGTVTTAHIDVLRGAPSA